MKHNKMKNGNEFELIFDGNLLSPIVRWAQCREVQQARHSPGYLYSLAFIVANL